MSATVSTSEDQVLPSFEAAHEAGQRIFLTHDAKRLYWTLEEPLISAIRVMHDKWYDPGDCLAPYCDQTEPLSSPSWSPVSQSPLTDPKISSVTVHVEQLDEWEDQWWGFHRDCADLGSVEAPGVVLGPLPDYDPDSDEDGSVHLLHCCGEYKDWLCHVSKKSHLEYMENMKALEQKRALRDREGYLPEPRW